MSGSATSVTPRTMQLLCLPHAGGGEATYQPWRGTLPAWIDLRPVALPGRGSRIAEPPVNDSRLLVDRLWNEWHGVMRSPYALFGHSMGALLAYELAMNAQRHGVSPRALFVSASAAPALRRPSPAWTGGDSGLIELVRSMGGTPTELLDDPEWQAILLPMLRADFGLCATYRYVRRQPLDCPVYVLAGEDDPATADRADVAAWCAESSIGGEIRYYAGGHFYLKARQKEVLGFIAGALRDALREAHGLAAA